MPSEGEQLYKELIGNVNKYYNDGYTIEWIADFLDKTVEEAQKLLEDGQAQKARREAWEQKVADRAARKAARRREEES